MSGHMQFTD